MENPEQWSKVRELFGAALDLHPNERENFLRGACGEEDVRAEVRSLLVAHESGSGLSRSPWSDSFLEHMGAPQSIGPYRLIKKLGEGGMGQVWLAEQTEPVRRQVALKLIRGGMYDEALLQRFRAERQSLAIMDHPAIAKVFEAGSAPNGQPYLVMEYVPGLPISDYCDEKKLGIADRLKLFVAACEGVQHAHQKAIIHRDLKPANILVVEVDGKPSPRIIDFGLAKDANPRLSEEFTNEGTLLGTPGYISPEQAQGNAQDVDTRTDVYSLGVILYVLLTGLLPFETKNQPLDQVLRRLREEEPQRPSARAAAEKQQLVSMAAQRALEPRLLLRQLRGDLDWIVMHALEKDRSSRYGTPSELAADIRRILVHEPVMAAPQSVAYRVRKYIRRNRLTLAAVTAFVVILAGFAGMQAIQLRRITRERDRADRVTGFMSNMFRVSDPSEARGNSVSAREILDKASMQIDSGLSRDPELQAQMMDVMGNVYGNLGLYQKASGLLNRSVEIRARALGSNAQQTLGSRNALALNLGRLGRLAEAEKMQRETLEAQRRVFGRDHPDTLRSMHDLAWIFYNLGHYPEAESLYRQTLEAQIRVQGREHPDTLKTMIDLATTLLDEGRSAEAEALQKQTLEIRQRVLGPEHPDTIASMINVARTMFVEGHFTEAETLQRETLEIRRRILGPEHPDTLRAIGNLATNLLNQRRYVEAEKMERETLATQTRVLGSEHPDTLTTMINLGWNLERQGRLREAGILQRKTLEIQRRVLGPEHRNTLLAMLNLAVNLFESGRYAEAEKLQRETLSLQQRTLGAEHPDTLKSSHNLALTLSHERNFDEAERILLGTIAIERRVLGPNHPDATDSIYTLALLEARAGKRKEALEFLSEAIDESLPASEPRDIAKADEFKSLLGDPRFEALVARAKDKTALAKKGK